MSLIFSSNSNEFYRFASINFREWPIKRNFREYEFLTNQPKFLEFAKISKHEKKYI